MFSLKISLTVLGPQIGYEGLLADCAGVLLIKRVSGFVPFNALSSEPSLHHPTNPSIQAYVNG